jgi:membrane dipeptidase
MVGGEDISVRTGKGHSDLPRFREGGLDGCFFSIWVPPGKNESPYFEQANRQIDSVLAFVRRNQTAVGLAGTSDEIRNLAASGKLSVMMGLEGGHPIGYNLDRIDHFYRRGVRYITLTWNNSPGWATSAKDEEESPHTGKHGLTTFGRSVVRRMNEIGMIIDVSHVGEKTFRDVISLTKKPVIASHSSVWKICPNRRNLKDEQIRALARTGGAVFVNFAPFFIDSSYSSREDEIQRRRSLRSESRKVDTVAGEKTFEEEIRSIRPPLSRLLDHIDYIAKLVGVDHVGIGSDFDGIHVTPLEMDDVSFLPNITRELLSRGYSDRDITKILGGNFLRILDEVQSEIRQQ